VVDLSFRCSHRLRASIEGVATWRVSCLAILFWSVVPGAFAQEIPVGFKLDRYARVWKRNPFLPVTPATPQAQRPAFDKLFLISWLKDGSNEMIFVQDSETNEVRRVTHEGGQNNLRLVKLYPSPDPHLVAAVISDGKEQGAVKFRLDLQSPTVQTPAATAQWPTSSPNTPLVGQDATTIARSPNLQVKLSKPQTSSLPDSAPGNQVLAHPLYPGVPRVHAEGGSGPAPRLR
jgi:hypothetical protein